MGRGSLHQGFFTGGCRAYAEGSLLLYRGLQGLTWWAWEGNYGPALYPALAPSSGGMFYQGSNDDKEIATEWGLIKDPQRDNSLVSRLTRRVKNNPILALDTHKDNKCLGHKDENALDTHKDKYTIPH